MKTSVVTYCKMCVFFSPVVYIFTTHRALKCDVRIYKIQPKLDLLQIEPWEMGNKYY